MQFMRPYKVHKDDLKEFENYKIVTTYRLSDDVKDFKYKEVLTIDEFLKKYEGYYFYIVHYYKKGFNPIKIEINDDFISVGISRYVL